MHCIDDGVCKDKVLKLLLKQSFYLLSSNKFSFEVNIPNYLRFRTSESQDALKIKT